MALFSFTDGKEEIKYEAENEADAAAALAQDVGGRIESFRRNYNPIDTAQDVSAKEQYFPQTSKQGLSARSVISDVASMPSRLAYGLGKGYETLTSGEGATRAQKSYELGMAGRNPEGGIVQDIAKSPSTGLGIATIPLTGGAGIVYTAARNAAIGATTEGAGSYLESGKTSPSAIAGGGIGGVFGTLGGKAVSALGSGAKDVARFGQEITGSSAEALEKASTETGRQAIKQAAGQETKIAKKLVDDVMSWESYSDEWNNVIKPAIDGMNDIDISPVLKRINEKITSLKSNSTPDITGARQVAIQRLETILDNFRGGNKGFPKTKYTGNEVYDMRKQLDTVLDFSGIEQGDIVSKEVNSTLKSAASDLRNLLVSAADQSGNPQYKDAMRSLSQKLDAKERLLAKIGTKESGQLDRAVGLIRNIESNAAPSKGELIEDIDNLFGKNYGEQARNAIYARDLAPADSRKFGEIATYPRQSTGRSGLGDVMGKATGWAYGPAAFSNVYIPAAKVAESVSDKTAVRPVIKAIPQASRIGFTRLGGYSLGERK